MSTMDVTGDLQLNALHDVFKVRLNRDGQPIGEESAAMVSGKHAELPRDYCGSCYGATETNPRGGNKACCNDCDDLKRIFAEYGWLVEEAESKEQCQREISSAEKHSQHGEGCRLYGSIKVNRVAGNVHVALGKTFHRNDRVLHQFTPGEQLTYNASHIIHRWVHRCSISTTRQRSSIV